MKKKLRLLTHVIIIISLLSLPTFSFANNEGNNGINASQTSVEKLNNVTSTESADKVTLKPLKLTIEDAVKTGLLNSIAMKQVNNEIAVSSLKNDYANYNKKELDNAKSEIANAYNQLAQGQALANYYTSIGNTAQAAAIQAQVDSGRRSLSSSENALNTSVLDDAGTKLSEMLGMDTLDSLDLNSTGNLGTTISEVSYEVTLYSNGIYKNQIAMLIKKSYYDVLKAQKLLDAKNKAMDRALKQYQFAQDGFKSGMKAKDDVLLADTYYKGTKIEYIHAQGDLNNALTELKKNIGISMDTQIELSDVLADKIESQNLMSDLANGLINRLEIKKAIGELAVYTSSLEAVAKKYPADTFQYREADLLNQKAKINLEQTTSDVEESIRQSYETMNSLGQMLITAREMVAEAQESLEISEYRYKEGYGNTDSALLKKLDIEETSGTIVEVLASEENLSQVEEKVVEITYGYNLAKMKYFNDIGKFLY